MKILLLTNNLLNEAIFIKKIQILDHEVFVSQSLLKTKNWAELLEISLYFDGIIFSETVSNIEMKNVLHNLKQLELPIIRKLISNDTLIKEENKRECMMDKYFEFHIESSLIDLRELLSGLPFQEKKSVSTERDKLRFSDLRLSSKEKKVLLMLHYSDEKILSRKELVNSIWEVEENESTLSQLSSIIKRIRRKILESGVSSSAITTLWGRGYLLEYELYDHIIFPDRDSFE
ncbi:winged helix-turn-helix domain-containing protein [Enterococcus sp. AZ196]|uniref:winged helix-turn-helix domain-containing protein n=1 Tax=Enterococcus sp. AZ196 TaxID=2774659 RepID=UPI003D292DAE